MSYASEGTLKTDKREVAESETWESQTDWEAYQSVSNIEITNGTLLLSEQSFPDSGVARYTFDDADTDNGTAVDIWNANNATINGATTGVSGANQTYTTNEAYSFEVSDNVITPVGDRDPITISCWINPEDSVNNGIIIETSTGSDGVGVRNDNGSLNIFSRVSGTFNSASGGSLSTSWSHVVGVFDGTNGIIKGYIDGTEVASQSLSADRVLGGDVNISDGGQGNEMAQDIDDVRVYDKALSATEVSDLYNTGSIL